MDQLTPGDPNTICHFCGCQSPHAYICGDCHHEFCLSCIETEIPHPPQTLHCPACGSRRIKSNSRL